MSLVFRNGGARDVPALARIVAHSFPALDATESEWERMLSDSPHGGVESLWVGEEEGRIVAGCRLFRFRQWIGRAALPVMGLSTVAISATHRRRGLAGRMTGSALLHSRDRGDLASVLYPFRTSFYRRLGYGMAGEVQQFVFPPRALPDHTGRARVTLVRAAEERAELARVYDQWAPQQTGQMVRSDSAWRPILDDDGRFAAVYRDEAGAPRGYAVFRYHTRSAPGGRGVEVEEIVWLDREARLALYGWLASLSDQWDRIIYRAHPEEAFPEHLDELRYPNDEVPRWHFWFPASVTLDGPMFRLLDLQAAWGARSARPGHEVTVALGVQDEQIRDNSGAWKLSIGQGRVEAERGAPGRADLSFETTIEPLSRVFIGALTPSAAVHAGLAKSDRPERLPLLDSALALPKPWTFDRF